MKANMNVLGSKNASVEKCVSNLFKFKNRGDVVHLYELVCMHADPMFYCISVDQTLWKTQLLIHIFSLKTKGLRVTPENYCEMKKSTQA